jgi:AraC-like DNA-binding protein
MSSRSELEVLDWNPPDPASGESAENGRLAASPTSPDGLSWDFRRGVAPVRIYAVLAAGHGAALDALLSGSGIDAADLADPDAEIEARQELTVVRNLLDLVGDSPHLGVEAGRRIRLSTYGIWGFALLSSPTLGSAGMLGLRYFALSFAFVRVSLEVHGEEARAVFDDREIPEDVRPFLVQRDLVAMTGVSRALLGHDLDYSLETRLDGAHGTALAEFLAGQEVRLGAEANVATFDRQRLDIPLLEADSLAAATCARQCEVLINRRCRREGVARRVRSMVLRLGFDAPMEKVARELDVDTRTLRRYLSREGTSYRALLDEARETLAVELLKQTTLTLDEISVRLGYNDASSFSNAFKRWTGVPPSAYRSVRPLRLRAAGLSSD